MVICMNVKIHVNNGEDYAAGDELTGELEVLYEIAWAKAPVSERVALQRAANLKGDTSPTMVFSAIAQRAKQLDPSLVTLLYHELEVKLNMRRMELDDVPLSKGSAHALQMAFAYELGQRIDRVLAEISGGECQELTQETFEAHADTYCVPWQVIAHAETREREGRA